MKAAFEDWKAAKSEPFSVSALSISLSVSFLRNDSIEYFG